MKLLTKRLIILPCTKELIETIAPEDYQIGPHIELYVEELEKDPTLLGWGVWIVLNKEEQTIIGDIGFKGKPSNQTVEIGYGISSSEQGKGYATEAVKAIINWALKQDGVNKIIAECYQDNTASIRVLEKVNMSNIANEQNMLKWELVKP